MTDAVTPADEIKAMTRTCATCDEPIKPKPGSPLGWTHSGGSWEGMRCRGRFTGAAPVEMHLDYLAARIDQLTPAAQARVVEWMADRYPVEAQDGEER